MSRVNPTQRLVSLLGWLILIGFVGFSAYKGYDYWKAYSDGYSAGEKAGAIFAQRCREQGLRALSFQRAIREFIEQNEPHRNSRSWRDSIYRQGWESALENATQFISKY